MAIEIEHKYLINEELWKTIAPDESIIIKQSYLLISPEKSMRIRIKGDKGYITIKGSLGGASKLEYEYEIPVSDAEEIIQNLGTQTIEKIRYIVYHEGMMREIDEFGGLNQGLIVAEIELKHEDQSYELPNRVTENITHDFRYANSQLSLHPYSERENKS